MFKVTADTVTNWELGRNKISRIYIPIIEEYLGYLPSEYELTDLAKKLVRYRWENSLSIKQLAKKIGVYYDSVMNMEIGKADSQKKTFAVLNSFLQKKC